MTESFNFRLDLVLLRWLSSKESSCPCRRCRFSGWGRSPGEGNGNPFQQEWKSPGKDTLVQQNGKQVTRTDRMQLIIQQKHGLRERQTQVCIVALLLMCDLGRVTLLVNVLICRIEMTAQICCEDFEEDVHNISAWFMLINFSIQWVKQSDLLLGISLFSHEASAL